MIKLTILTLVVSSVLLQANNFTDGMRAYRKADYDKAKVFFELALEKDKVYNASHLLGKMYLNGNGVEQDIDKSIKYFEFAHKQGNIIAGCYASKAYMEKGIYNWGILENGLIRGLKHKTKYCFKVVDIWMNNN
ncbi:SEL1-like repeat protein [Sulfurospirillum arcachonense]|uniref:SEL1-like repeat protein n=1 Tax=Sulfurospirillum arcachonense TaxID=57666 RepID=UPI0004691705|nr:SEL1-like repeat protein [Sulfurospirillum arcachonense]